MQGMTISSIGQRRHYRAGRRASQKPNSVAVISMLAE
jgi:hypothetical protein